MLSTLLQRDNPHLGFTSELSEWNIYLYSYYLRRPQRNAFTPEVYRLWYRDLPPDIKELEDTFYKRGYYKWEGVPFMFKVKGKDDKHLHVDDIVLDGEEEAVIMSILSETEVQINPIGKGLPRIVPPSNLSVKYSFIEKLRTLKSDEELQAILRRAEALAQKMGQTPSRPISRSTSTHKAAPAQEVSDW